MADKRIDQLASASTISPTDISVLESNSQTFQYTFSQLIAFLATNASTGSVVSFGTSVPANTSGNNNDVFVKTDSGQFYQRIAGTWTVVYTIVQGVVGSTIYYGASAPSNTLGINGDTFLLTATGVFYQKQSGTWVIQFSMATGPAGPRGYSVLNGSGAPNSGIGNNGDFYIDTTAWYIYGAKSAGAWPSGTSIIGAIGNTVLNGVVSPANTQGNNGDFYYNTATSVMYGPKAAGVWPTGVSLIGASGTSYPTARTLFYPAGVTLPITISSFWGTYSQFGRFPNFKMAQVLGQQITSGTITGGTGYTNGTYTNISLTGGTGAGAKATIVVAGGIVTGVTITTNGTGYSVTDQLTATGFGAGTGFKYTLTAVTAPQFQYLSNATIKTTESTIGQPDTVTIDVDNAGGTLGDNILLVISN